MRYEQDKRIAERGHKIYVISCKTFGAPAFESAEGIKIFRDPAITLPVIEYPLPNLIIFYSWVSKMLKGSKIDIVHVEDGAYLTSLLGLLVKRLLKKPVVLSMQGFPGFSWFYGSALVDWMAKIYSLTLGKIVLKNSDTVVLSATAYVEDALRLGVAKDKVEVISRGVDERAFFPSPGRRKIMRRKLNVKADEKMILFAGRLVPVKGLKFFLEAARTLVRNNKKLVFVVAGDGILRGKFEKETLSQKSNIRFIGYRHDMPDVINAADVFVLSSISEGFPNAVLEASACAKPVVSTRVGGAEDIIMNGETGLLVEPGSVENLCHALEKVLAGLPQATMGDKALRRVREHFTWDFIVSKWEKVYSQVLGMYPRETIGKKQKD